MKYSFVKSPKEGINRLEITEALNGGNGPMLTTDAKEFSIEQRALNAAAREQLTLGATYRFDPPVNATAVPTGGQAVCALADADFDTGSYIGFVNGAHVFQGKPINDTRHIPVPSGYEYAPNLEELCNQLRDSYFHVAFIGGQSVPTLIALPHQG